MSSSTVCPNFNYVPDNTFTYEETPPLTDGKIHIGNYTCPGSNPKLHTECCSTPGMRGCCPKIRYFYEIDRTLAAIIAITVTTSGIVFTIAITICCFWSRCPFYSACRAEYTPEIATYVNKECSIDLDTMPTELSKTNNKFSPVVVSNGNLRDDDNNAL
ncbi:hypothetical protein HNY73_019823 [Argiope bruennichi]|uniref:Uncharacterized protein n=2 Tax=Argiope bruennichi TaxID=94029 RepID=A0A8T0E5M7_ARGBR|nr:hypothetical protein HNY73_019823 [Argiope bruennichi]